jgi:hypothetical protein
MAAWDELIGLDNKFSFRGKTYRFKAYFPVPSFTMEAEDGTTFSFGEGSPISKEFKLLSPNH